MTSPLADYLNARFHILPASASFNPLPGLETPVVMTPGYVVDLYAKHGDRDIIEKEVRGSTVSTIVLNGYCVRWTEIAAGPMPAFEDELTGAAWDESGRFPDSLLAGSDHPGCMLDPSVSPHGVQEQGMFHFIRLRNPFGIGGIGKLIQEEIGDRFQIWYSRNA